MNYPSLEQDGETYPYKNMQYRGLLIYMPYKQEQEPPIRRDTYS